MAKDTNNDDEKRDEVLKRMLGTKPVPRPPDPQKEKPSR